MATAGLSVFPNQQGDGAKARNANTEMGTDDDFDRQCQTSQSDGKNDKDRKRHKIGVFLFHPNESSLLLWRGGIRGEDGGRMLIKQNTNWKDRKEKTMRPPFQLQSPLLSSSLQETRDLMSANQVVIGSTPQTVCLTVSLIGCQKITEIRNDV